MAEVYTSIGSDTDLGTATPTSCSGGVVTFSSAPSDVSVGDKATMVDEGSYFATFIYRITAISGSTLTLEYVEDDMWTGATSPCDLVDSMWEQAECQFGRFYTSLYEWEQDLGNTDVYDSGDDAVGEMHNDSVFNETVDIDDLEGLNSIKLTVHPTSRHLGVRGAGALIQNGTSASPSSTSFPPITMGCNNLTVEWISISCQYATDQAEAVLINAGAIQSVVLSHMMIDDVDPDNSVTERSGIKVVGVPISSTPSRSIINNFIWKVQCTLFSPAPTEDKDCAAIRETQPNSDSDQGANYYNNTISTITTTRGLSYGFQVTQYSALINNIAMLCNSACFKVIDDSYGPSASRHNLSTDETAADLGSDSNQLTAQTPATTGVRHDYILANTSQPALKQPSDYVSEPGYISMAIDRGTPLAEPLTDIHGDNRIIKIGSNIGYWDIGADESPYSHPFPATVDAATSHNYLNFVSPATAIAGTVDPTILGIPLVVTPIAATAEAVTVNPTVVFGSLSITPSPATADAGTVAPSIVIVSSATADAGTVSPSVVLGSFTVTPSAATVDTNAIAPITVQANAATADAQTSTSVEIKLSGFTATANTGTSIEGIILSKFTATADAGTVTGNVIEILTPSAATADIGTVAPTTILGSISITPNAATADTSSSAGTITLGSLSFTPSEATADAGSVNPTVDQSSITVWPVAITSDADTVAPTITLGSFSVTPSTVATANINVAQGLTILGSFTVTPTPPIATAKASTPVPTIIQAGLTVITRPPIRVAVGTVTGTFGYSSFTLTPAIITSDADTVAPSIVKGSLSVIPAVSTGDAATTDPTVIIGPPLIVSPDPALADTGVYIPLIVPAKATASIRAIIDGNLSDKIKVNKIPSLLQPSGGTEIDESFISPEGTNLLLTKPALTTEILSIEN